MALRLLGCICVESPAPSPRVVDLACSDLPILLVEDEDAFRLGIGALAHPAVPIVLLTGYTSYLLQREVAARDFLYLAQKPAHYDDLHGLIHKVVAWHPLHLEGEEDRTPAEPAAADVARAQGRLGDVPAR